MLEIVTKRIISLSDRNVRKTIVTYRVIYAFTCQVSAQIVQSISDWTSSFSRAWAGFKLDVFVLYGMSYNKCMVLYVLQYTHIYLYY